MLLVIVLATAACSRPAEPPRPDDPQGTVTVDWATRPMTEPPVPLALGQTLEVADLHFTPLAVVRFEQPDPLVPHAGSILAIRIRLENRGEATFRPETQFVLLANERGEELLEARLLDPTRFDLPERVYELEPGQPTEDGLLAEFQEGEEPSTAWQWHLTVNPNPDDDDFRRLPVAIHFTAEQIETADPP